jgi:hypothetical protein
MHQQSPTAAFSPNRILKRRPQIGSEWADRELHAAFAFIMFASRGDKNNGRRIFCTQQTGLRKHTFTGSIEVGKLATDCTLRVFATRLKLPKYGSAIRRN